MFEHYKDVMDVYDVAEALCIGKNRVYELLGNGSLKGFGSDGYGRSQELPCRNISLPKVI